jgi:hypothetical protein
MYKKDFLPYEDHIRFKNFLNNSFIEKIEVDKNLIKDIDSFKDVIVDKNTGRATMTIDSSNIDMQMISPFINFAKNINKNAELDYVSFVIYNKKYGPPQLAPHYDRPSDICFLIDYQVDSSINWDLTVDGQDWTLADNDLLLIDVSQQIHWRRPRLFSDKDYVSVVFFAFVDKNRDVKTLSRSSTDLDQYMIKYKEECRSVYGDQYSSLYKSTLIW